MGKLQHFPYFLPKINEFIGYMSDIRRYFTMSKRNYDSLDDSIILNGNLI